MYPSFTNMHSRLMAYGLIVCLDMYRLIRKLSFLRDMDEDTGEDAYVPSTRSSPRIFFILSAVCHVRQITSPGTYKNT